MTGNKLMVRCRRRHKVHSDSEDVTMDGEEESLPSTSTQLHNNQEVPTRISSNCDVIIVNHLEYAESEDVTMRRRRIIGSGSRPRRRETISAMSSNSSSSFLRSSLLLLLVSISAIIQPCFALQELRCGPIDIRNRPWGFLARYSSLGDKNQLNPEYNKTNTSPWPPSRYSIPCTIVEGSLSISFIYNVLSKEKIASGHREPEDKEFEITDYPTFPNLREITGTLLVFETNGLTDLGYIFPNLRVIGGQKLVQHYSLIIYRNNDLETLNMPNLSVIRNGGVRVQDNKKCCRVHTIGWKQMIQSSVNDVIVDKAAEYAVTETGIVCPRGKCQEDPDLTKCNYLISDDPNNSKSTQSCWSNTTCQPACGYNRQNASYFGPGCAPDGSECHEQCIGGCEQNGSALHCYACRNVYHNGACLKECPSNLYLLMGRRCVSKEECLALNPRQKRVSVRIKATAGICSDKCPNGWEVNPSDPSECLKCQGKCENKCSILHKIDTYGKAQSLQHCNIIDGNLVIEIRGKTDGGMAAKLKDFFAEIHTITGYLTVMRSPPLLSLGMFKKLKLVRGDELFQNKFAISVIDNQNLRQLFEENTRVRIGNPEGTIQVHNNRMLCFSVVEKLVAQLGVPLNETFQSLESNGDKAICQDANIDVTIDMLTHEAIRFEWDAFDTSDSDFRKFLGYELFFKEVDAPDPKMAIDDDRSACVDSWNSVFIPHYEPPIEYNVNPNITKPKLKVHSTLNTMNNRIRPNTVYAYYVATQMVHHPGAKNGMSKIGFVKTRFSQPESPILVVRDVKMNEIELSWEPPRHPNGDITHYTIAWRELDVDIHAEASKLCNKEGTAINTLYTTDDSTSSRPDETTDVPKTSNATSIVEMLRRGGDNDTCSAIQGCCTCSSAPAMTSSDSTPMTSSESPDVDTVQEQANFENQLLDTLLTSMTNDSVRQRRSIRDAEERDKELELEKKKTTKATKTTKTTKTTKKSASTTTTTVATPTLTDSELQKMIDGEGDAENNNEPPKIILDEMYFAGGRWEINVTAKEAENSFVLKNLKHYTKYSITIAACQNVSVPENGCSIAHKAATIKRTLFRTGIDTINESSIAVSHFGTDEEPGNLLITWDDAPETNGGVLGYMVSMISSGATGGHNCVPNTKGFSPRENGTKMLRLSEGVWTVRIETISAHGKGAPVVWSGSYEVHTPAFWLWYRLAGAALTIFISIIVIAGVVFYNVKYKFGKRVKKLADFMHLNPEYCVDDKYTIDDWEVAQGMVEKGDMIGEGTFGKVYLGTGKNLTTVRGDVYGACAIKQNSLEDAAAPENMNYLMEANVMKNFKAAFVVKLFGVISTVHPAWVIMEHMELGNLRDYLRSKREDEIFDENDCNFYDIVPRAKLCEWAAQVCDGMAYLESLKFCHRDLAARNCMINKNELVKIGDFGMARDLFYHDYYKPSGKRMMPVRWMSPESLQDGKFDSKSDVWAFGVVLYEIVTLGAQPYIGLSNDEVLNYISMSRKVIKQPDCCTDYWYKIMKMCWRFSPRDRPTFLQLVHLLSAEASEEFKTLSFVFTENQMAMEDSEPLELDEIFSYRQPEVPLDPAAMDLVVAEEGRRMTDSIQMKEFNEKMKEGNSHSTISSVGSTVRPVQKGPRQRSLDDEYTMMNHTRVPSDVTPEIRPYNGDAGDYVERDVAADVPTRRNTGNSNCSYTGGQFCMQANRGGSNERAGFGEGLRLHDGIGSGHHLHDDDYGDALLNSMDTRRSTGASTASYGVPHQTNWSGSQTKGATFYENKKAQAAKEAAAAALAARQKAQLLAEGRGDRIVTLPGLYNGAPPPNGAINGANGGDGDYVETEASRGLLRNNEGSPSRNGNFNRPRTAFTERERLIEDHEN